MEQAHPLQASEEQVGLAKCSLNGSEMMPFASVPVSNVFMVFSKVALFWKKFLNLKSEGKSSERMLDWTLEVAKL